ncbi:TlpA disulfide reductase family protein [Novosphingobium sp. ZN18A2]|uniref:TlpA disulfide reductase family protein n=1 Tax=Novosphingobium sp. ZN18A2 TaxID=3079861 RepID=UPI0030CC0D0F
MSFVSLGPLVLSADRLVAVVAIWLFVALVAFGGRRLRQPGERAALWATALGLVAARAGYVAAHLDSFAAGWASAFAVWQGGFMVPAGLVVAALVLVVMLRGARARGLALAALAATSAASLGVLALIGPAPVPLPKVAPLERLSGAPLDFAGFRGRPVVINLWATWCPPCRRELPLLAEAAKDSTVPIVLVNSGEDAAQAGRFLAREGIAPDHVALDPAASLAQAIGVKGYPVTLFIDAHGMIVQRHTGEIGRAGLADGITEIEKEE